MRFLPVIALVALVIAPIPVWAQAAPPATVSDASFAKNPLTITTPPGSVVTFEADGREGDLLGIIKSIVTEVEKSLEAAPVSSGSSQPSQAAAFLAPFAGFLEGKKFSDILKDVTHIHVVIYRKTGAATSTTTAVPASVVAPAPVPQDYLAFHETLLTGEGGRRLLYANDGGHYLVTGFDAPRGMAVVVDDGSRVTVVRTDGYIDFKATAALVLGFAGISAAQETTVTPAAAVPAVKTASPKPAKKAPAAKPRG